jgi:hypothetical protein
MMPQRPELGEVWVHQDKYPNGDLILGKVEDIITHANGDPEEVTLFLLGRRGVVPSDRKLTTLMTTFLKVYRPTDPKPEPNTKGPTEWDRLSSNDGT